MDVERPALDMRSHANHGFNAWVEVAILLHHNPLQL
jgi:hypothetical protein